MVPTFQIQAILSTNCGHEIVLLSKRVILRLHLRLQTTQPQKSLDSHRILVKCNARLYTELNRAGQMPVGRKIDALGQLKDGLPETAQNYPISLGKNVWLEVANLFLGLKGGTENPESCAKVVARQQGKEFLLHKTVQKQSFKTTETIEGQLKWNTVEMKIIQKQPVRNNKNFQETYSSKKSPEGRWNTAVLPYKDITVKTILTSNAIWSPFLV